VTVVNIVKAAANGPLPLMPQTTKATIDNATSCSLFIAGIVIAIVLFRSLPVSISISISRCTESASILLLYRFLGSKIKNNHLAIIVVKQKSCPVCFALTTKIARSIALRAFVMYIVRGRETFYGIYWGILRITLFFHGQSVSFRSRFFLCISYSQWKTKEKVQLFYFDSHIFSNFTISPSSSSSTMKTLSFLKSSSSEAAINR
jgi:hypothetical protein